MGLLSKTVKIFPTGKAIAHYKELGYDAKHMQELEVKVEDLTSCSTVIVEVECDYCGKIKLIKYVDYNAQTKNGIQKCCCLDCAKLKQEESMIEKYGHKAALQVPEIKKKVQTTNQEKYGSNSPTGNKKVREKQKETMLKKYGVEYPSQSKEIRDKIKATNMERYGVENVLSNKFVQDKIKQTNLERYGVENVFLNKEIKDKRDASIMMKFGTLYPLQNKKCLDKLKETNMEKYGVENISQFEETRQKIQKTFLEKYGVNTPSKNKEVQNKIKETNMKKYGAKSVLCLPSFHERSRQVDMERYGVYHHLQNSEILAKQKATFYKHGTCLTSKQQNYICNLYKGILNFPVKHYNADIYLSDNNLIVEYDGSGHSLSVIRGNLTQEEFDQKEIIRNNIIKREGYKQMRIISSRDLLPSDQVLLQMLSDTIEYFSNYPDHSWIEFNIDLSILRNAEYKDGILYDYGDLRTIKEAS